MEFACKMETLEEHIGEVSRKVDNVYKEKNFIDSWSKNNKESEIRQMKPLPDVIIIDDDDDENGKVENHQTSNNIELCDDADYESDAGSRSSHRKYHEYLGANSDEHDKSSLSWCLYRRARKGEKRPVQMVFDNRQMSSTSSDCEIIEDLDGKFRHEWEEAALRKQLEKAPCFPADSEESTTITSLPCTSGRKTRKRCLYQETSPSIQAQSDPCQSGSSNPSFQNGRDSIPILFDQQDSNHVSSHSQSDSSELRDDSEPSSSSLGNDTIGSLNEGTSNGYQFKSITIKSNVDNTSKAIPTGKDWFFLGQEPQKEQFAAKVGLESPAMKSYTTKGSEVFEHIQAEEVWWQVLFFLDGVWYAFG